MERYTNAIQTAELAELGWKVPTRIAGLAYNLGSTQLIYEDSFSESDLIDMICGALSPIHIEIDKRSYDHCRLAIKVKINGMWHSAFHKEGKWLIDLLFDAIVELQKEKIL